MPHTSHNQHIKGQESRRQQGRSKRPPRLRGTAALSPQPPGEPSSSRRCRRRRTTGCGCRWRPAAA
eukprot:scaffold65255_cov46-Phaeocystis_antarctica.AAC.3